MSTALSPMLRHALESFEHGVLHYLDRTEVGRKFALLHIDHSIELLLKEKVAQLGHSVFGKDGKTISIYEAYSELSSHGVAAPERPRLDDLHEFRNIVQHRGLTPDEYTTEFYVKEAYAFVKRFACEQLDLNIESFLPRSHVRAMEMQDSEIARRLLRAEELLASGHPEMALVSGFIALETASRDVLSVKDHRVPLARLLHELIGKGILRDFDRETFERVQGSRNIAAHSGEGVTQADAREGLDFIGSILDQLYRGN